MLSHGLEAGHTVFEDGKQGPTLRELTVFGGSQMSSK